MLNLRREQTGRPSPASGGAPRGVGFILIACVFAIAPGCAAGGTGGPATADSGGSSGGSGSGGAAGTGTGGDSAAGSDDAGGSDGGGGSDDGLGPEASDASPDAAPDGAPEGAAAAGVTDASLDVNATGPNLFVNADFAMGLKGWQTAIAWKGDGITAAAGSALIHGDDAYAPERVLDLFQTLTTNGMPYVVSFEFQRRNPQGTRPVQVYCQQADGAKTVFGLATCTISNVKSTCKVACAPPAGVMVSFGLHGGQSFLDFYADMASLRQ